jgi:hypothetical protein
MELNVGSLIAIYCFYFYYFILKTSTYFESIENIFDIYYFYIQINTTMSQLDSK